MIPVVVCQRGHGSGGGCRRGGLSHAFLPAALRGGLDLGGHPHLPSVEASLYLLACISKTRSRKLPRGKEDLVGCSTAVTTAVPPSQNPYGNWRALLLSPLTPFELDTGAVRHGEAKEEVNREGSSSGCFNKMAHFSLKLIG